jgi:hypothetical protein
VATKTRPHIKVTQEGYNQFRAEIPEKWGKRVFNITLHNESEIADGYYEGTYEITNVYNDGRVSALNYQVWALYNVKPGTKLERVEEQINGYFNHESRIFRMLRVNV